MDMFSYMLGRKSGGGSSGGGGADWSAPEGTAGHVLNRTHYEETVTVGGDTLTWDGNTEGKTATILNSGVYYHVSDAVPSAEVLQNGYSLLANDGSSLPSTFVQETNGVLILESLAALVCPADMVEIGGGYILPKKGVYFMDIISSLTIPGYTGFTTTTTVLKKLDSKYLPESLQFGEDKAFEPIVWDGNTEGLESFVMGGGNTMYRLADFIPYELAAAGEVVVSAESTVSVSVMEEANFGVGGWVVRVSGNAFNAVVLSGVPQDMSMGDVTIPNGLWAVISSTIDANKGVVRFASLMPPTTLKPMDEKYIPDTIARLSDVKSMIDSDSGDSVSWNDLTDRPFGETVLGGDTLTWDGNTEGLLSVEVQPGYNVYKISNATPTADDFAKDGVVTQINSSGVVNSYPLSKTGVLQEMGGVTAIAGMWLIVTEEMADTPIDALGGITISEPGVYSPALTESYLSSMSVQIKEYTGFEVVTTLDPQYLPKHTMSEILMVHLADSLTSIGDPVDIDQTKGATFEEVLEVIEKRNKLICAYEANGYLYVASDYPNFAEGTAEEFITLTCVSSTAGAGGITRLKFAKLFYTGENAGKVQMYHNIRIGVNGIPDWVTKESGENNVIQSTNVFTKETTFEDSVIIKSSTEGSTKKFKITVDDSGTLSAAEVTE